MSWKKRKVFRVLVVGPDKESRQRLIDHYYKKCEHGYIHKIYNAKSVTEAQNKIDEILMYKLDLVLFSAGFLTDDKDRLREHLNSLQMATPFVTVFAEATHLCGLIVG
jgi:hypothetical protein